MTIGESLKRARKKMGLELDDVARSTKIAKMFLIALENDDISSLPQGVYARNFLRTYARFLKLDEDILTTEYHEQYAIKPQFVMQHEQTKLDNQRFVKRRNRTMVLTLFLLAVPLVLFLLYWQMQAPIEHFVSSLFDREDTTQQSSANEAQIQPGHLLGSRLPAAETPAQTPVIEPAPTDANLATTTTAPANANPELQPTAKKPEVPERQVEAVETLPPFEMTLPLKSLNHVKCLPRDAASLEDVFVIAAREAPVRIQVVIDGIIVSDLNLKPGKVRVYSYGQRNSVSLSDCSQVTLQDGSRLRARASTQPGPVRLESFGPRQFFSTLDQALAGANAIPGGHKP